MKDNFSDENTNIKTIEQVANIVFDVFPEFKNKEIVKNQFIEYFKKAEVKPRTVILNPYYIEKFVLIKVNDKEFDIDDPDFEIFNSFFGYF